HKIGRSKGVGKTGNIGHHSIALPGIGPRYPCVARMPAPMWRLLQVQIAVTFEVPVGRASRANQMT
ncbi:MAG: hypothetical protein ACRDSE_25200, partial [Pseudonocardiaceae bacterium]